MFARESDVFALDAVTEGLRTQHVGPALPQTIEIELRTAVFACAPSGPQRETAALEGEGGLSFGVVFGFRHTSTYCFKSANESIIFRWFLKTTNTIECPRITPMNKAGFDFSCDLAYNFYYPQAQGTFLFFALIDGITYVLILRLTHVALSTCPDGRS